jgi:hypothetical protein
MLYEYNKRCGHSDAAFRPCGGLDDDINYDIMMISLEG